MTSVCGSFLGLGGLTEVAAGLAIAAFLLLYERGPQPRILMTTEGRASRARALPEQGRAPERMRTLSTEVRGDAASLSILLNIHEREVSEDYFDHSTLISFPVSKQIRATCFSHSEGKRQPFVMSGLAPGRPLRSPRTSRSLLKALGTSLPVPLAPGLCLV